MARFVIVIDTQKDFMDADGALSVVGAQALTGPMNDWLARRDPAKTAGVLFTYDTHDPAAYAVSEEAKSFPIHCVRGSSGWANVLDQSVIDPAIPVWRLEKSVFDMWAEDGLMMENARDSNAAPVLREDVFAQLRQNGVSEVEVIGVAADYCVRWAIDGLIARGFRVIVPAALTKGIARQMDQVAAEDFANAPLFVKK